MDHLADNLPTSPKIADGEQGISHPDCVAITVHQPERGGNVFRQFAIVLDAAPHQRRGGVSDECRIRNGVLAELIGGQGLVNHQVRREAGRMFEGCDTHGKKNGIRNKNAFRGGKARMHLNVDEDYFRSHGSFPAR